MAFRLAVPKERKTGETRVALVPDTVARLIKAGFTVAIETGAGASTYYSDDDYQKAGAQIVADPKALVDGAQVVLAVQPPDETITAHLKAGSILISFLAPHAHKDLVKKLQSQQVTSFGMELIPRVTRAQSMDALSSQATVAGYKAVLVAADHSSRFFPMLTTAAGTIRPAKVMIIGAGVAGLQAIATARRLGAVVEAYDVRPAVKEQIESLGARFIETGVKAEGSGGYARELTDEEKLRQKEVMAAHVARADAVITTAQVPGRPAPRLITDDMVANMRPGSVIVDLAAESGGNCALTKAGTVVCANGVSICGPVNIASELPIHASEMYAKNLYNFLMNLTKDGKTSELDWNDEIIAGSALTHAGAIKHEPTRKSLEG